MSNAHRPRGGFVRYGNFIWIDQGRSETCINLARIESARLTHDDFNSEEPWEVHVGTSNESLWHFGFTTEQEARNFLRTIVGDSPSAVSNPLEK